MSSQTNNTEQKYIKSLLSISEGAFPILILLFSFFLLNVAGCGEDFNPIQEESEYSFSIYGYLDASTDTQWVRVTSVRDQLEFEAESTELNVTIENLETGREIVMQDSIFFNRGARYLNFWTTEPIEHNTSYRLTVIRPDGEKAQSTVQVPSELPTPTFATLTGPGRPSEYFVLVDDKVHLADVQARWFVRIHSPSLDVKRVFTFSYRNSAVKDEEFPGVYTIELFPDDELNEIERRVLLPVDGEIEVIYRQVFVASSGTAWSSGIASLDELTYSLPNVFSNVENGVGFLAGIDSKIIPYSTCTDENTEIIPCPEEEAFW